MAGYSDGGPDCSHISYPKFNDVGGQDMKLPHRKDDPLDTWPELYTAWAAVMFTVLVVISILSYFANCR